jgi:hypothetical protein
MRTISIALIIYTITLLTIGLSAKVVLDNREQTIKNVIKEDYFILNNVIYKCEGYFKGYKK